MISKIDLGIGIAIVFGGAFGLGAMSLVFFVGPAIFGIDPDATLKGITGILIILAFLFSFPIGAMFGWLLALIFLRHFLSAEEIRAVFYYEVDETTKDPAKMYASYFWGGPIGRIHSRVGWWMFKGMHPIFVIVFSFLYRRPRSFFRHRQF